MYVIHQWEPNQTRWNIHYFLFKQITLRPRNYQLGCWCLGYYSDEIPGWNKNLRWTVTREAIQLFISDTSLVGPVLPVSLGSDMLLQTGTSGYPPCAGTISSNVTIKAIFIYPVAAAGCYSLNLKFTPIAPELYRIGQLCLRPPGRGINPTSTMES